MFETAFSADWNTGATAAKLPEVVNLSTVSTPKASRVVIAEDEALIRLDLAEMLAEEGYDVVGQAEDGEKAIALVESLQPDLVILDIKMPRLDGLAVAERVASQRIAPVVILTAFSQRDLVDRARDAGAMAYLVKPFSKTDLVPAIEMAVSRFAELRQLEGEVHDLGEQLATRKALDRAKGVLQQQLGLTEPESFRWVQKTAMDLRLSMRQVAEGVLEHGPQLSSSERENARIASPIGRMRSRNCNDRSPERRGPLVPAGFGSTFTPSMHRPQQAEHRPSHHGGSMIRPTRTWRVAAVFAAATLVLTACGSESDSGSDEKSDSGSKAAAKGDGTLTIGTLLPQTGDLAFLGPPEFAGVQAAVDEINEAGGVDGKEIVKIDSDSGDGTPDIAGASVDKLLAQNADVIVGAASSNVSKSVIDKITGAGVVQFSPANTAAGFDEYPDKGLYFRTAPSDVLQGKVVANLAVQDGNKNVAVLARQDFYGEGLAESAAKNVEAGGGNVVGQDALQRRGGELHRRGQRDRGRQAGRDHPGRLRRDHEDHPGSSSPRASGPQDVKIYFVDGNLSDYSKYVKESSTSPASKGTSPRRPTPTRLQQGAAEASTPR